jgi:hypothetical protein
VLLSRYTPDQSFDSLGKVFVQGLVSWFYFAPFINKFVGRLLKVLIADTSLNCSYHFCCPGKIGIYIGRVAVRFLGLTVAPGFPTHHSLIGHLVRLRLPYRGCSSLVSSLGPLWTLGWLLTRPPDSWLLHTRVILPWYGRLGIVGFNIYVCGR